MDPLKDPARFSINTRGQKVTPNKVSVYDKSSGTAGNPLLVDEFDWKEQQFPTVPQAWECSDPFRQHVMKVMALDSSSREFFFKRGLLNEHPFRIRATRNDSGDVTYLYTI